MSDDKNEWWDTEDEMKTAEVSDSALLGGSVQNGVVARIVTCVGCKEEFEDLHFMGDYPDENPVCDNCIQTMEP